MFKLLFCLSHLYDDFVSSGRRCENIISLRSISNNSPPAEITEYDCTILIQLKVKKKVLNLMNFILPNTIVLERHRARVSEDFGAAEIDCFVLYKAQWQNAGLAIK